MTVFLMVLCWCIIVGYFVAAVCSYRNGSNG